MTKADKMAMRLYPDIVHEYRTIDDKTAQSIESQQHIRDIYIRGYKQAEKDLILTWRDIKTIVEIADKMVEKDVNGQLPEVCETEEGYYKAILKEFNKTRK